MRSLSDRLTYANVMATVAVFLALGGISWAATSLPRNSVGNGQLKRNAVTGSKVKNGSLTAADLKKGTITAGAPGAQGPPGAKGDTGATGPSDAYQGLRGAALPLSLTAGFATVVATPTLPAGNYTVTARANLSAGGSSAQIICSMGDDAAQGVTLAANQLLPLAMTTAVKLASPGAVDMHCLKQSGSVQVFQAVIVATKVGTLSGTFSGGG